VQIPLAYGTHGLALELGDSEHVTVLEPRHEPALANPAAEVQRALRHPLAGPPLQDRLHPDARVGVVFSDLTRPVPHRTLLPAVLTELSDLPRQQITLFNALGTHRPNSSDELRAMVGGEIVDGYRIVQNDAFDPSTQIHLGQSARGHEIWLNRALVECDLLVLTGFIEPHLFAGFSGGGKAISPGMAGLETILHNHSAAMVGDPRASYGVTNGNPVWEEIREVAQRTGPSFLLNVALNRDREITGVFAGDLHAAHRVGCSFVGARAMVAVPQPFDLVITTNSGYPLDLNLYQAVKGMRAAERIVRDGGAIILVAECRDGIPEHGHYGELLRAASSPRALLDRVCAPGFLMPDQWQAQLQAQTQLRAEVHLYSDGLSDEQIRGALLHPCRSIEQTIASLTRRFGRAPSICVLPQGPQTIPCLDAGERR
jgi:lactate racemase